MTHFQLIFYRSFRYSGMWCERKLWRNSPCRSGIGIPDDKINPQGFICLCNGNSSGANCDLGQYTTEKGWNQGLLRILISTISVRFRRVYFIPWYETFVKRFINQRKIKFLFSFFGNFIRNFRPVSSQNSAKPDFIFVN